MSIMTKDRAGVVSFEARRSERTSVETERRDLEELRRELEQQGAAIQEERRRLEAHKAEFEEELGVLEAEREAFGRNRALATQRERVESVLEDARKSRETERLRLQAEMAGLFQRAAR